jgi:hypothetical protein
MAAYLSSRGLPNTLPLVVSEGFHIVALISPRGASSSSPRIVLSVSQR